MNERILVIGLGRLGMSLVENLATTPAEVIAVDEDIERVNDIKNIINHSIQGDSTDLEFLKQISAGKADKVILCMGENLESSILTITLLLELGARNIVARASSARNAKILQRVGAHETFFVENEMGKIMASRITRPSVLKEMELGFGLKLVNWMPPTWTYGKSLSELSFPSSFGVQVVALFDPHHPENMTFANSQTTLREGLHCLLIGTDMAIDKLLNAKS